MVPSHFENKSLLFHGKSLNLTEIILNGLRQGNKQMIRINLNLQLTTTPKYDHLTTTTTSFWPEENAYVLLGHYLMFFFLF